jgi:uncharacterized protein (DUF1778 family)
VNHTLAVFAKMEDNHIAQNLVRNKNITFRVTQEEYEMIRRRMEQTNTTNLRAFLLKMAIDGQVINVEMTSVNELGRLLRNATNNINQIARRVNEMGRIHENNIKDIQVRQDEIWNKQDSMIKLLSNVVGRV